MNLTFINASIEGRGNRSVRIVNARIAGIDVDPSPGDRVIDLDDANVLPGLINAHDHLQLNSLPRPALHQRFSHARDWIAAVTACRPSDPEFEASAAVPRDDRLLIGGIKNLLSGVTTVAQHDPLYPFLSSPGFPVRVVCDYGWAHSLYVNDEQQVVESYQSTPQHWPWIIHLAEGVNRQAGEEFERLEAMGCLRANTLLVHGIALSAIQRARLIAVGAGLIWCPSSNLHLFGSTADVGQLAAQGRLALGTDSRLSGNDNNAAAAISTAARRRAASYVNSIIRHAG